MNWSNKNVLITGGAGFIGKRLSAKLLNKNANVVVLDNYSYSSPSKVVEGIESINVDVSDSLNFKSSLSNFDLDFIFHFGAPSSIILFYSNPVKCFNETIMGLLNVFEYAQKNNIRKVVFPSSGSVYGRAPLPQSEDQIPMPVNLYGVAKLCSEHIASCFAENTNYIGLRIFAGYGPGEEHKMDYASPVTLFLKSILCNSPPVIYGDGTQNRDFIYIDDIIKAILRSCEVDYTGIINIGTGVSYTFNDVVTMINDLVGKNIKPAYVHRPKKYLERTCADITKMTDILCVKPLSVEEGLNQYLEEIKT